MMYKAKVAVCSDIHTKHSTQSERHVEFLNFKLWWYVKKPPGFKRLIFSPYCHLLKKNRLIILIFASIYRSNYTNNDKLITL